MVVGNAFSAQNLMWTPIAAASRLDQESPWWVPEAIDDRVFEKIFGAVQRFLADVSTSPEHEVRSSIDQRIRVLAVKLRDDPVPAASLGWEPARCAPC